MRLLRRPLGTMIDEALADHQRDRPHVQPEDALTEMLVHGDRSKLHIDPTAVVNNALFNLSGGEITVGRHAFFGHRVTVLTGAHDINAFGAERQQAILRGGHDVFIGEGVWLASNVTVLGPCTIGANAVVGACSLVREDVQPYTVVAGTPARVLRTLAAPEASAADDPPADNPPSDDPARG